MQTIAGVTSQVDPTATARAATNLRSINSVFATNNSTVRSLNVTGIPAIPQPAPSFPGGINLGNTNQSYSANVGIIGAETLGLAIRAIEENAGSDLMSSPSLTVLDGKTAVIKVAQLLRYPQAYGDTQSNVGTSGGGGNGNGGVTTGAAVAITAGTPQDFTIQEVGVTLEVTPTVAADDSIALNLKPKVTEFEGFVEYGGTSVAISGGVTVSVPSGFFQPIFSTREVTTEVTVFDGATVVIGGLTREEVKTIDDKVPVLGSIPLIGAAFRSSGKSIQKKSLMVFVTANLVSPGGATLRSSHPGMRAGSTFSNPIRLFFWMLLPLERKAAPMSGMEPRTGTLSSMVFTSSRVRPPMTTVAPSKTVTSVVTSRVLKIGWKKPEGTETDTPPEMAIEVPPYSTKPSNSVTFGLRFNAMESSAPTVGVTSSDTPTCISVKSWGVPAVIATAAPVVPSWPPPPVPTLDWVSP